MLKGSLRVLKGGVLLYDVVSSRVQPGVSKKHHRVFVRLAKGLSIYVQKHINELSFDPESSPLLNLENPQLAGKGRRDMSCC